MQSESYQQVRAEPFEIIYNARGSQHSKSRKSSISSPSLLEKKKSKGAKKVRKMTLTLTSLQQSRLEQALYKSVRSQADFEEHDDKMNDEIDNFFKETLHCGQPLGLPDLQKGIPHHGTINERDLDSDFNLSKMATHEQMAMHEHIATHEQMVAKEQMEYPEEMFRQ